MISPCLVPHLRLLAELFHQSAITAGWWKRKRGKKRQREWRGEWERNAISPPTTASHRRKQFTDESNFISFALHKKRGDADIFSQTDAQQRSWDRNSFSYWRMRVGGLPRSDNKGGMLSDTARFRKGWYLGEREQIYKVFTCSSRQILTFWENCVGCIFQKDCS